MRRKSTWFERYQTAMKETVSIKDNQPPQRLAERRKSIALKTVYPYPQTKRQRTLSCF